MDFGWDPELESFRQEVRDWCKEFKTPEVEREVASAQGEGGFRAPIAMKIKDETDRRGWLKKSWPTEMGGEGKSPWYGYILTEELQKSGLPSGDGQVSFIAPAIMRFGSEEQREKYLPGLWSGKISCALGYSEPALKAYILYVFLHSTFIHANVRFDFGVLRHVIATPQFHHWHHGIEQEAIDVNFAVHFPLLDRLFGTHHLPGKAWPAGYGVGGHPVPEGYWQQFLYPLKAGR